MPSKNFDLFPLFERFIRESRTGKRLQPNGKKLSPGTVRNYHFTLLLLQQFSQENTFPLRLRQVHKISMRDMKAEQGYWKRFYRLFCKWMYEDRGYFDNYTGATLKNIRTFFGYLNKELGLQIGEFHKQFYVRKEEIAIFPLLPEELNFLITNRDFYDKLSSRMKEVNDFVVFGCTVALRFSDLIRLKKNNIRIVNGQHYLAIRSQKTNTESLAKLPDYAMRIVDKYKKQRSHLLPRFNMVNLNKYIKLLFESAGFMHEVYITRNRRGHAIEQKKEQRRTYRFCDVASTHTMRRTAITTMLSLGMSEQVVRKISGHSATGKDFYRYVSWAQSYQDQEAEKMFEALANKKMTGIGRESSAAGDNYQQAY